MNNSVNALSIALNVIMLMSILSILFSLAWIGLTSISDSNTGLLYYYQTDKWSSYDCEMIKGNEIRYLVENTEDIALAICTKATNQYFYDLTSITDINSVYYVDPDASYYCNLIRRNDEPVGVMVTEVGANPNNRTDVITSRLQRANALNSKIDAKIESLKGKTRKVDKEYDTNVLNAYKEWFKTLQLYEVYGGT